ncbi:MAG: DUF1638 domain-containing protein [Planctomycetota bacterium]
MNSSAHQPADDATPPRTAIILCAVLELEIEHFAARAEHIARIVRLEQGLHNEPDRLRERVQAAVDRVEAETDAEVIVLGYGLCSRGTQGVLTRRCRLVIPRAHDCITLLLGDRQRYREYVAQYPGTYWYSPGWIKHHLPPGPQRYEAMSREYREKYGEDNAEFLLETEAQWHANYDRATYVDVTGIGATQEDIEWTRECARWLGWRFDRQSGDADLLKHLVFGPWDAERFLTVQPGETIRLTGDDRVIDVAR